MNVNLLKSVQQAVKPNLLDRAINYFAPQRGAMRMRARAVQAIASGWLTAGYGGYQGAKLDRRATANWVTTWQGSADSDTLSDIPVLRDRSRDLLRNEPMACGAIGTVVMNVVGSGLALQSKPNVKRLRWSPEQAKEWAENTEAEFRLWADSTACDVTRTQDFYGLQNLAFRSALESGDSFALLPMIPFAGSPYQTCIQIIEADRITNPNHWPDGYTLPGTKNRLWGGVEKDFMGAPIAYHILREHPGNCRAINVSDRYLAFDEKTGRRSVLHLFDRLRPDQSRGVPYLAPVIEVLKQLGRYSEAELMAAVVSSLFTVFIKSQNPGQQMPLAAQAAATIAGTQPSAASGKATTDAIRLGNGLITQLSDGYDIEIADPKRPNVAFDGFVQALCRQVGVALGLPFEVLVKHFTASYSAARAALLEAWKFYMSRRVWLANFFCQPAYEVWMAEAVSLGRIAAPGFFADASIRRAYLGSEWVGDAQPSVDPTKDVDAAKTRLEIGVSSLQRETMEITGQAWEEVHAQQVVEHNARVRDGLIPVLPPASSAMGTPANVPDPPSNDKGGDMEKGDAEGEQ